MLKIEYCTNSEYLASDICREHDVESWQEEVATEYKTNAVAAVERLGFEVERAQGQRILYHGWNGAHFNYRCGIFGVFGVLTKDEEALLYAASDEGYTKAVEFAIALQPISI